MDQQQATISPTIDGILAHNRAFVERRDFERYTTDKYPDKKLAIVSCMDTAPRWPTPSAASCARC